VNLLPFIDIQLLKDTIATHCPESKLSVAERKRNALGKIYCYRYDLSCTDVVESPGRNIGLSDIVGSHSSVAMMDEDLSLSKLVFEPKLIAGTQIPYPGFPSLNVLPIASVELTPIGLNCFGSPSKYPNTILTMHEMPELPPIEQLAENVLGISLFVNWPMMHESKVVAISDDTKEIRLKNGKRVVKEHSKVAADRWSADSGMISQSYYVGNGVPGSGGIQIGEIKIRLKVLPLQGMRTNPSNGSTKKLFGNEEADVPLQLALWQAPAPDPRFVERGPMTLQDRFPEGCSVVLTKGKYRGCLGTVVGVADKKTVGVKVQTVPPEMPFGLAIARSVQESFLSSSDAARILKIHPGVLGKVMGKLQFEQGRYDLGLNLKTGDGMCVVGYTRKKIEDRKGKKDKDDNGAWAAGDSVLVVGSRTAGSDDDDDERIQWEYTPKAIRLVETYKNKFPQLFAALKKKPNERAYDANDVFGPKGEAWLPVVREWLDKHESAKIPRSPVTTQSMSVEATAAVQKAADVRNVALKMKGFPKESLVKVPGSALYREGSTSATDVLLAGDLNDSERPELGDRIVNLCADGVSFGARGTVIGIHEAFTTGSVEVVMDEEFIGGTSLQGHCANFRGKLCLWSHLLRIAPDNSQGLVDKLVPKGVREAAMHKAVSGLISEAEKEPPSHVKSSWDCQVDSASRSAATTPEARTGSATRRASSKTPPRSSSRAGSTGRGRQGGWREARGPDEKGIGFKGIKRGGKSGLNRWKTSIQAKAGPNSKTNTNVNQTAADLKKMLGVSAPTSAPKTVVPSSQAPPASADQLKAMLGVSPPATHAQAATAPTPAANASAGLKAMLGVQSRTAPQPQPVQIQQRPAAPASAADKLFQLMAGKQQSQGPGPNFSPGPTFSAPSPPSGFNFTYVEEGKEAPPPPPRPNAPVVPQPYSNFPMHPSMPGGMPHMSMYPMPMQGYGSSPQPKFGFAPPPPPPMPHPAGPSSHDFPPLGGGKPEAAPPAAATVPEVAKKEAPKTPSVMVPSAIAGKTRR